MKKVQDKVFKEFSVLPDRVLQGKGTSNTGNSARTCFSEPAKFAKALGLNEKFVQNLALLLSIFKSRHFMDQENVEKLCKETNQMHFDLYPWAKMKPSLHKFLVHGCDIAKQFPLPIGFYSEDASESWHKYFRQNEINHSRQNSRRHRILDLFNRAIYLSDPKISFVYLERRNKKTKKLEPSEDMKKYLSST